mmetsp:Transcript_48102/g.71686  ORF Transcript_48102/g.71686 Transcript_48102/m.71686 type:complete len:268 (-) Transcript_48102:508-1311(-)
MIFSLLGDLLLLEPSELGTNSGLGETSKPFPVRLPSGETSTPFSSLCRADKEDSHGAAPCSLVVRIIGGGVITANAVPSSPPGFEAVATAPLLPGQSTLSTPCISSVSFISFPSAFGAALQFCFHFAFAASFFLSGLSVMFSASVFIEDRAGLAVSASSVSSGSSLCSSTATDGMPAWAAAFAAIASKCLNGLIFDSSHSFSFSSGGGGISGTSFFSGAGFWRILGDGIRIGDLLILELSVAMLLVPAKLPTKFSPWREDDAMELSP